VLHGRTYFEEVIRIPLIVRGPGVPRGLRIATPVHLVDVAPTLLDAAGIDAPAGCDGLDLGALWRRPGSDLPARELFAEADHNNAEPDVGRMLRVARHKLIYDRLERRLELYDLGADPREQDELGAREAALAEELMGRLERFMQGAVAGEAIDAPDEDVQRRLRELGY
jgi:arylsulfatase A-like enzyme